jgi:hypothetical protein
MVGYVLSGRKIISRQKPRDERWEVVSKERASVKVAAKKSIKTPVSIVSNQRMGA